MRSLRSTFGMLLHLRIFPFATGLLISFVVTALSSLARGGEIHGAVQVGDLEEVQALIGADPNFVFSQERGDTPLFWAAYFDRKAIAELLIANRADVNASNLDRKTPLLIAALQGSTAVAELLLANGAEVGASTSLGDTPLHLAVLAGHTNIAALLLATGAEVYARDDNGETPLHFAAARGRSDAVRLLLANQAEVDQRERRLDTIASGRGFRSARRCGIVARERRGCRCPGQLGKHAFD
jgi:ankyrin repeat protein